MNKFPKNRKKLLSKANLGCVLTATRNKRLKKSGLSNSTIFKRPQKPLSLNLKQVLNIEKQLCHLTNSTTDTYQEFYPIGLEHFSTFLMLQPFNSMSSSCCDPQPYYFIATFHNCNFATVRNQLM